MNCNSRNQNYNLIIQCIYIKIIYIETNYNIDDTKIIENIFEKKINDVDNFSKELILKTFEHFNDIIPIFKEKLINWKWERIAYVTRAILLMSFTRYNYMDKVNKAIVIDTAVKFAKKYLNIDDYKFINGILDKILL